MNENIYAIFLSSPTPPRNPLTVSPCTYTDGKAGKSFHSLRVIRFSPFDYQIVTLSRSTLYGSIRQQMAMMLTAGKVHALVKPYWKFSFKTCRMSWWLIREQLIRRWKLLFQTGSSILSYKIQYETRRSSYSCAYFHYFPSFFFKRKTLSPHSRTCHKINSVFYVQTRWWRPVLRALLLYCFHRHDVYVKKQFLNEEKFYASFYIIHACFLCLWAHIRSLCFVFLCFNISW